MKTTICASLILSLVACGEDKEARYGTWDEAEKAGAIERGWVPHFIPKSARNIRDVHNLDTNAQMLRFNVSPADVQTMLAGLPPISANDEAVAADMARGLGVPGGLAPRLVCHGPLNGALFVSQTGLAVFKTPVSWANDDCKRVAICSMNLPYDSGKADEFFELRKKAGCDGAT